MDLGGDPEGLLQTGAELAQTLEGGDRTWTRYWHLACVRAVLATTATRSRPGYLQPLGTSWRHGASRVIARMFADSVAAAPAVVLALLNEDAALAEPPAWTLKLLRRAIAAGIRDPAVLRGCISQAWRVADTAAAGACAETGLAAGEDSTFHALTRARVAALRRDTAATWAAVQIAAQAVQDAVDVADLGRQLRWFLSPAEDSTWRALAPGDIAAWLSDRLLVRDIRDGRAPGARVVEHFRRLDFVEQHFQLQVLPVRRERLRWGAAVPDAPAPSFTVYRTTPTSETAANTFRAFTRWQTDFDDRGVVWMRFGAPTERWYYTAPPGITLPHSYLKRETWRYDLDGRSLLLSFESEQGDGSEDATRLVTGVIGDHFCGLDVRRCVQGERALEAFEWNAHHRSPPEDRRGIAVEEVLDLQRQDAEQITQATTTDDNAPRPAVHLRLQAQYQRVWDPRTGRLIALVPWAVPVEDVARVTDQRTVAVRMDIRSYRATDQASWDSVVTGELPVPPGGEDAHLITGLFSVATTPATSAWSVALRVDTVASGRVFNTAVSPLAGGGVVLSDLVLGVEGRGVVWHPASGPVLLTPSAVFPRQQPVRLFYQIRSERAADSAQTSLALFRLGRAGEQAALRLSFVARLGAGLTEVRRVVDLSRLEPGRYRLEARVSGVTGRPPVSRSTLLTVQ
jgi:hypothetical protein